MNDNKWGELEIEKALQNSPKIQDTRSKEDIFKRLQQEGIFDEEIVTALEPQTPAPIIIEKKKRNIYPRIGYLVALFALIIIVPLLLTNNKANDSAGEAVNSSQEALDISDMRESEEIESFSTSEEENSMEGKAELSRATMEISNDFRTALYEDEVVDETIFTIGLSSDAAESVPVSLKIPQSFIEEAFEGVQPTYLQLYGVIAPLIKEDDLGFSDYHPFKGHFEEQGMRLIHYLPVNHPYDLGSASISNYMGALEDTFGNHYEEVLILNENGSPIEFSHLGILDEPVKISGIEMKANYFIVETGEERRYLSTNFRTRYATVEEAFSALAVESNDIYQSALIKDVAFSIEDRDTVVAVSFELPFDVYEQDEVRVMEMIEAMVLTAASFGKQTQFINIVQSNWNGFEFDTVLPRVLGVNELDFESIEK